MTADRDLIPRLDTRRSERLGAHDRCAFDAVLRAEIGRRPWYHRMDLGNGVLTPGRDYEGLWNLTRRAREEIDYRGKAVLDLGSWDGMWAFEAEALGATLVVATDCAHVWHAPVHVGMQNCLLVREALFSDVMPLWNVSPTNLRPSLTTIVGSAPRLRSGFDIVQHLGLLYHLRDPMLSLAQARSVLREGGTLLLETAVYRDDERCAMYFNGGGKAFYDDTSTWWAPTRSCLREMLDLSLFELDEGSVVASDSGPGVPVMRAAMRARARAPRDVRDGYIVDPAFTSGFGEELIHQVPGR
jgi:SAM-dependent methyltransferase